MLTRSKAADTLRFVMVEGVIKFGIPTALIYVLLRYVMKHELSREELLAAVPFSLVSGILYGFGQWIVPNTRRGKLPGTKEMIVWVVIAIGLAIFFAVKSM